MTENKYVTFGKRYMTFGNEGRYEVNEEGKSNRGK